MAVSNNRPGLAKRSSMALITLGVQRNGPISRVQLAKSTGFSITHVCRIVDELMADGELIETTSVAGPRGRPTVLLDINPDSAPVAGLRLGPELAEIAIADSRGHILARRTVLYDQEDDSPDSMVLSIAQAIQRGCRASGRDPKTLRGVGVSVAGLADPLLGVIDGLTNRRGWEGVPVAHLLGGELGVPVYVDNDVRAGALASQWFSEDGGDGGALYVYVSEGVGAAFVQNDRDLLRGVHDAACLLGHTTVDPDGPQCGCGNFGCLEAFACDVAFIRHVWPDLHKTTAEMTVAERVQLVGRGVEMAKRGDVSASKALTSVTRYLGIGIANAVCMFDPRTVFIFGTLIDIDADMVIDQVRRESLRHIWPRARGVEIRPLMRWQEFLLRGSVGMVLWQPYKALQGDNDLAFIAEGPGPQTAGSPGL